MILRYSPIVADNECVDVSHLPSLVLLHIEKEPDLVDSCAAMSFRILKEHSYLSVLEPLCMQKKDLFAIYMLEVRV